MDCCSKPVSEIMAIDKKIRHIGVFHDHAKIYDEIHEDAFSYFDKKITESMQNSSLQMLRRKSLEDNTCMHYAMARYEEEICYIFSLNDHDFLLVSTEPDANSDLIISRILDYLKH